MDLDGSNRTEISISDTATLGAHGFLGLVSDGTYVYLFYSICSGFGFGIWDFGNFGFGIWDLDLGFSGLQFSLIDFYLHAFAGTEYVPLQETGSRPRQGPQSFEGIL